MLCSLGHAADDAQKTMGGVSAPLYAHGALGGAFHALFRVAPSRQAAIGLGTFMGGWRIVHIMVSKITRLTPPQGFPAETGGAVAPSFVASPGARASTARTVAGRIVPARLIGRMAG